MAMVSAQVVGAALIVMMRIGCSRLTAVTQA
jgi:hypothetical protein